MIQFPCTCDHLFTVDDDQVGADIQCPDCGRLNSVPSAADLGLLSGDGTYQIDGPVTAEQPNAKREEELKRVFGKSRVDADGTEIDLRSHAKPLDYQRVGVDPLDLVSEGHDRPAAPKYDPETGELIRPMDVQKTTPQQRRVRTALPLKPRKRRAVQRLTRVSPVNIFRELFKPTNFIVICIFFFLHVILQVVAMFPIIGIIFAFVGTPLLWASLTAHLGNVIDETGPSSRDELPRPLRDLNWSDDIWSPIRAVILTVMLCYGPAVLFLFARIGNDQTKLILAGAWMIFGTLIAPVILLTTATSGSIANLRPDRVYGTLVAIAGIYPFVFLLMLLSVGTYGAGYLAWTGSLYTAGSAMLTRAPVAMALLFAGIFLLHYFCWTLGHVYRVYHWRFPWAYQGAVIEPETDARAFAVVNPKPIQEPTPLAPQKVLSLDMPPSPPVARTRDERLDFVRKSDAARKRESDSIIKNLPGNQPNIPFQ